MKIVGSGCPEVMTARLERRELPLWREELHRVVGRLDAGREGWAASRSFGGYRENDDEELRAQRVEARRLLAEIDATAGISPEGEIRVAGPAHLIFHVAQQTAARAAELVLDARHGCPHPLELTRLREPIELLAACLETLDWCRWVDGHGFDYYAQGLDDEHSRRSAIEPPPARRGTASPITMAPPRPGGELRPAGT